MSRGRGDGREPITTYRPSCLLFLLVGSAEPTILPSLLSLFLLLRLLSFSFPPSLYPFLQPTVTDFSLCVELHNHTRHYEPRYSMRWSLVRWSKHSASFRKFSCLCQELTVVMREYEPKESYQVGLKVKHSCFHRVTTIFLPAVPICQIHTQCISL